MHKLYALEDLNLNKTLNLNFLIIPNYFSKDKWNYDASMTLALLISELKELIQFSDMWAPRVIDTVHGRLGLPSQGRLVRVGCATRALTWDPRGCHVGSGLRWRVRWQPRWRLRQYGAGDGSAASSPANGGELSSGEGTESKRGSRG